MKKTLSLLAAMALLAVLLLGGRAWMAGESGDELSTALAPRTEETPARPAPPLGRREVAGRDAGVEEAEKVVGPLVPRPSFVTRGVMGRVVDRERQGVAGDPPVPPGRYELRVISFAFEAYTRPIEIRVGETTSVAVELVPSSYAGER